MKYLIWFYTFFFTVVPTFVWGVTGFTILLLLCAGFVYYIHWLCREGL